MKFVGLRLDTHGANVTYTDGPKIKYCEIARDLQIKHFGYDFDLTSWVYVLDRWGVDRKDIDAICISFDPQHIQNSIQIITCWNDGDTYWLNLDLNVQFGELNN